MPAAPFASAAGWRHPCPRDGRDRPAGSGQDREQRSPEPSSQDRVRLGFAKRAASRSPLGSLSLDDIALNAAEKSEQLRFEFVADAELDERRVEKGAELPPQLSILFLTVNLPCTALVVLAIGLTAKLRHAFCSW